MSRPPPRARPPPTSTERQLLDRARLAKHRGELAAAQATRGEVVGTFVEKGRDANEFLDLSADGTVWEDQPIPPYARRGPTLLLKRVGVECLDGIVIEYAPGDVLTADVKYEVAAERWINVVGAKHLAAMEAEHVVGLSPRGFPPWWRGCRSDYGWRCLLWAFWRNSRFFQPGMGRNVAQFIASIKSPSMENEARELDDDARKLSCATRRLSFFLARDDRAMPPRSCECGRPGLPGRPEPPGPAHGHVPLPRLR